MKKRLICALLLAVSVLLLGGCGTSASGWYRDSDKYTMGGAALDADGIETIDIAWTAGRVTVCYHDEDTIVISETSNRELDEKTTMYYWANGGTLKVKFAKSGQWNLDGVSKELTVCLPEGMQLKELIVDSASADVLADEIAAEKAVIETASGDVKLGAAQISESAKISTASGDVTAELTGKLKEFSAETVSGAVDVTAEEAEKLKADTVSGDVRFVMKKTPDSLSADTVSGNVALCLPQAADFTLELDTVSGSVNSSLAMKIDGDSYIFGRGTKKFEVNTVSGNVKVEEAE